MKKIVSNVLIVSTQLIVGGLFLFMLFSDSNEDNRVVVVENNNLDKMADAVSELFVVDHVVVESTDKQKEEELLNAEQKKAEEEAQAQAQAQAEAEAQAQAAEAARLAQEEAERKAQEEAQRSAVVVDATGYVSKPAMGFNVTTGNRTYSLSDDQFAILATVVNCEANRSSKDDILAVMTVILNRADRNGIDPVSVVAAPYQFSCYTGAGSVVSESVASVMRDALAGVRNHNYYSFNGWYSSVSDNYIVSGGNRYY
ncbi:MAG: cell wall hydrolase [Erysipelotrichaceae bacterium]|nr:cell wall hydrolase [Erysipelotrichaceae bacterium]